ncbi:hypothetical protein ABHN11_13285 [Brevibacillus centrosporus]|jgi:hypothetical protein|uniref:hypothetical protein n=1 Tax=Brevibacillus centrosporus TaxID=54910 RepID=UPI003985DADD
MKQFALVMIRDHFGLYMIYDRKNWRVSHPLTEEMIKSQIGLRIEDVQTLKVSHWTKDVEQLFADNGDEKFVVIYEWD